MTNEEEYINIFMGRQSPDALSEAEKYQLLYKGMVYSLLKEAKQESIQGLKEAVVHSPISYIPPLCLEALEQAANKQNSCAIRALFYLYIEHNIELARLLIEKNSLKPDTVEDEISFAFLSADKEKWQSLDGGFLRITQIFENSSITTRERLIHSAAQMELTNWMDLARLISNPNEANLEIVTDRFSRYGTNERTLAINRLEKLHESGFELAADTLCKIFIQTEDEGILAGLQRLQYTPMNPLLRVGYYIFSGQWDEYQRCDFDGSQVKTFYENAPRNTQRRILEICRYNGFTGWISQAGEKQHRLIREMTATDWETCFENLFEKKDYSNIWRLILYAPPKWGNVYLRKLQTLAWQPETPDEVQFFHKLLEVTECGTLSFSGIETQTRLEDQKQPISAVAGNLSGKMFSVSILNGEINIWDYSAKPKIQQTIIPPGSQITQIAISATEDILGTASLDNQIRFYRLGSGKIVKAVDAHSNRITSLAFHPSGKYIFSAGFDQFVKIWRIPECSLVSSINPLHAEIQAIALTDAGNTLVIAGNNPTIVIWDWNKSQKLRSISTEERIITKTVSTIEGNLIACYGNRNTVQIWNSASGKILSEIIPGHTNEIITCMSFMPGERYLITGSNNGIVKIWDILDEKKQILFESNLGNKKILDVTLLDKNKILVTTGEGDMFIFDFYMLFTVQMPIYEDPAVLQSKLQNFAINQNLSGCGKKWFEFILNLVRWKSRFDFGISNLPVLSVGEFDIQLD